MESKRTSASGFGAAAPKRPRATSAQVDLIYPFWYQADAPSVNPPFLDPSGPLFDKDGKLSIRLQAPVAEVNKSVGLLYDGTMGVNNAGQLGMRINTTEGLEATGTGLAIKTDLESIGFDPTGNLQVTLDPEGPIVASADGLQLQLDGATLEVADWELGVKLDPNEPIDAGSAGLKLNIDETLLVDATGSSGKPELGVHLNPNGPVTADSDGIDLEIDSDTLKVDTSAGAGVLSVKLKTGGGIESGPDGLYASVGGSVNLTASPPITYSNGNLALSLDNQTLQTTGDQLSLKLKQQGGLQSSVSGLGIAVDETLEITSNTLEVKPDPSGPLSRTQNGLGLTVTAPIAADSSGVRLKYDTTHFTVTGGVLSLAAPPANLGYTSISYVSGSTSLNSNTAEIVNSSNNSFKCSYYVKQVNCMGMLFTSLYIKLDSATMGTRPTGNTNVNAKWFNFIVSSYLTDFNPSQMDTGTLNPAVSNGLTYMEPAPNRTLPSNWDADTNTYYEPSSGVSQSLTAVLTGSWAPGNITVVAMPVIAQKNQERYTVLCFSFRCTNGGLFNPSVQGTATIGPVNYICEASQSPNVVP